MTTELFLALSMMIALTFYALMAGADYGGGVWDLFASGPRAQKQRELIAHVVGPIWEANHVWLILLVVLLFGGFPAAFALISTGLHVPITIMLIGIVLRGSSFTFRTYDTQNIAVQKRWGAIFSMASVITPIALGTIVGAISSGALPVPKHIHSYMQPNTAGPVLGLAISQDRFEFDFIHPWLAPFPIAVGVFALALFAFLAATYLTCETEDQELQNDFRLRALISQFVVAICAATVYLLSSHSAPGIFARLSSDWFTLMLHIVTAIVSTTLLFALWTKRFPVARTLAAMQTSFILWGWAFAQFPYVVRPDLTIFNAASPHKTIHLLLLALCAGVVILFPSLFYLFSIFHPSIGRRK